MKYAALNKNEFQKGDYKLIPIRKEHMESIRQWRNQQMNVLRQKQEISELAQQKYFEQIINPLFSEVFPNQLLFSFLQKDILVGYGGLVNISWQDKRAEMSFLVNPEIATNELDYKNLMSQFIALIKELVFKEMQFNRLFTETYSFRNFHISILVENGFIKEGTMRQHILENGKFCDSILHSTLKNEND